LADAQRLDTFAKRDHPVGAFDTGNERGRQMAPQLARPHPNIHEVDTGRADLDERLAPNEEGQSFRRSATRGRFRRRT
jgi:hypothetical protein